MVTAAPQATEPAAPKTTVIRRAEATPDARGSAAPAEAASEHRLTWRWSRFSVLDYASTAVFGGAYLYLETTVVGVREPNWRGGILFDDAVRSALRGRTRGLRESSGAISDYLTLAPQGMMVIDSVAIPLFTDRWNYDVAWQMTLIMLQAEAITGLLSRFGHRYIGRERPDVEECRKDPEYHHLCFGGSNASFPSGHTSGAFVGAGVVCAHHTHLPLYGGGAPDIAACAVNLTMATASSVLRLIADRHYLTDNLVGAAIGLGAGWGVPLLLHYRGGTSEANEPQVAILPMGDPQTLGISAAGVF